MTARPVARGSRLAAVSLVLAACAGPPPLPGLLDLLDRQAERALLDGMRAYDEGQYTVAEKSLRSALAASLSSPRDRATAHKLLAFIHCTSDRLPLCESEFRLARQADPGFMLTRAESGHPSWGPVYRRVLP